MSRIEKILREYVAFDELSDETQREIVRRIEEIVDDERKSAAHFASSEF